MSYLARRAPVEPARSFHTTKEVMAGTGAASSVRVAPTVTRGRRRRYGEQVAEPADWESGTTLSASTRPQSRRRARATLVRSMSDEHERLIDRAIALLRSESGRGICANCLAELLAVSSATVRATVVRLEAHGDFTRGFSTCAVCEKDRLVLRAATVAS